MITRRFACLLVTALVALATVSPVAQAQAISAEAAGQLLNTVQRLQQQVLQLNGRIEELENQNRRLMRDMRLLQQDTDQRLAELEGGPASTTGGQDPVVSRQATPDPDQALTNRSGGQFTTNDLQTAARNPAQTPDLPATPNDLYLYAYNRVSAQDYAGAEQAFQTFLQRYPDHELAGKVHFYLGEVFYAQRDYTSAARQYATGLQNFAQDSKAPDMLYKLGVVFRLQNQNDRACTAYTSLLRSYANAPRTLLQRAEREIDQLRCPR